MKTKAVVKKPKMRACTPYSVTLTLKTPTLSLASESSGIIELCHDHENISGMGLENAKGSEQDRQRDSLEMHEMYGPW